MEEEEENQLCLQLHPMTLVTISAGRHAWTGMRETETVITGVIERRKLQALVYDILPATTAVFSYAIGFTKLSANEQFFCWCSNSTKFVTNNSNKTRHDIYSRQQSLHQQK